MRRIPQHSHIVTHFVIEVNIPNLGQHFQAKSSKCRGLILPGGETGSGLIKI